MPCRCEILANLDRPENATCFVGLVSMVCFFHGKGKRLSCVATETWKHCPPSNTLVTIDDSILSLHRNWRSGNAPSGFPPTMGPLYSCLGLPAFQKLINLQKWTARRTIQPFLLWFYIFVTIFQHLWTSRRLSFSVTRWSLRTIYVSIQMSGGRTLASEQLCGNWWTSRLSNLSEGFWGIWVLRGSCF